MYYTVSEISGDYAVLRSEESGLERSVALGPAAGGHRHRRPAAL